MLLNNIKNCKRKKPDTKSTYCVTYVYETNKKNLSMMIKIRIMITSEFCLSMGTRNFLVDEDSLNLDLNGSSLGIYMYENLSNCALKICAF